ncbi:beta-galactosidase [Victivallis lenta]|nr:beta-galactosidase [Victivallis lenta]
MRTFFAVFTILNFMFAIHAADIAMCDNYQTDFDNLKSGGIYLQEFWRVDDWRYQAQSLAVVGHNGGKALNVTAKNGHHARIYITPRRSGGGSVSFDFTPGNGIWTFFGFKPEKAKWDEFQAALLFPPASDGKLYRLADGKKAELPGTSFSAGSTCRVTLAYRYGNGKGIYRFSVEAPNEKNCWRSEWLPFETAADRPVGIFEIRSIEWNKPESASNGIVDNFIFEGDRSFAKPEIRSSRFSHLFRRGEPVGLNVFITAGEIPLNTAATVTVTDAYGKTVHTQTEPVTAATGKSIRFPVEVPSEKLEKLGLYHASLNIGGDHPVSAESTFGILTETAGDCTSFDSPFGAFLYPLDGTLYAEYGPDYMRLAVQQMRELGIRWVRCNFHWYSVEPEKGKFHWGKMGELVDELYRQDMHAFAELVNTTRWATSRNSEAGGSVDTGREWQSVAPRNFADWETFCARTAERFKGKIKVYEIWNEPGAPRNGNSNGFWRDSSENFIEIIKHGAEAIRSIDPEAKIMVSGFRAVDAGRHFENFVERVLPQVIQEIDIISFHHWGSDAWSPKIYDLKRLMKEYERELPYWDSEGPGAGKTPDCIKNFIWTWSMGAEKVFPFIYNLPRYPDRSLVNPDYTPTPGTMTFATMTRFLAGLKPEGQVNAGPAVRAFSFSNGKRRIVAAWSELPDNRPATATLSGLIGGFDHYGNPLEAVKKGSYGRNSIIIGAAPCFLELDFDGLDPHAAAQKP